MMNSTKLFGAVLLAALSLAGAAKADDLHFLFNDSYVGNYFSFDLPSMPTPTASDSSSVTVTTAVFNHAQFEGVSEDGTTIEPVQFFIPTPENLDTSIEVGAYQLYGPQLFSGSTSAPVFMPLITRMGDRSGEPWDVTISEVPSAAPEASTWGLLVLGVTGAGIALRSRRRLGAATA